MIFLLFRGYSNFTVGGAYDGAQICISMQAAKQVMVDDPGSDWAHIAVIVDGEIGVVSEWNATTETWEIPDIDEIGLTFGGKFVDLAHQLASE